MPGADVRVIDLGDAASIAALASVLASEGITLDALVNNAAISMRGFDTHVADRTLAVSLLGTLQLRMLVSRRRSCGSSGGPRPNPR